MSEHGRAYRCDEERLAEVLSLGQVLRHRGTPQDFIERYRRFAKQVVARKVVGLRAIAPRLLYLISRDQTLFAAWQYLAKNGGEAPGEDGHRYDDFTRSEVFQELRKIRDEIRNRTYTPDVDLVRNFPKRSNRGFRPIVLQSIFDRVVQRAVVEILQSLLDPLFDPLSFGYRPKRGTLQAVATAIGLCSERPRRAWVAVDIADAFSNVPIGRLPGVLRHYFPDDDLLTFIETVIRSDKVRGLRQGGPLSPLLLNLYLHHLLDLKWRQLYPDIPLIRFADDILLLCDDEERARAAYRDLAGLLRAAGLRLKETEDQAVRLVENGEAVHWLGFEIRTDGSEWFRFSLSKDAWDSLKEKVVRAHDRPSAPLLVSVILDGWIADKAPCFPHVDIDRVYARINRMAAAQGFEEILTVDEVRDHWQGAYAGWSKLRMKILRATV